MTVQAVSESVQFQQISVHYRELAALSDVSLELPAGQLLALLGPSGCGKSTLLRSIAGFVPHTGEIYVGSRLISRIPAHRRNIGMVFQDYALFPHMTVAQNVGFGLRMRRVDKNTAGKQVAAVLNLVDLKGFDDRMARQLSGGQQQRVALARALVIQPTVLLLDEPLSALDKKLREEMRAELKRIQQTTGVTTIFVTHDQDEALALADKLAFLYQGRLLQAGSPEQVYRAPASRVVAEFLGAANRHTAICRRIDSASALLELPGTGLFRATIRSPELSVGETVTIFIRPEQIRMKPGHSHDELEGLAARVAGRSYLGRHHEFTLSLPGATTWTAHLSDDSASSQLGIGSSVTLTANPDHVIVFTE